MPTTTRCPRCDSPDPKLHPAMQHEGEVQICSHTFHETKEGRPMEFEIRRPPGRPKTGRDKTRGLRLADTEYQRMVAAASKQGLSFSEWARQQLVRALSR